MKLSKNFSIIEGIRSATAEQRGIINTPDDATVQAMKVAAMGLECVRKLLGQPITPTSWYRSPELNAAVGGSKTSAHLQGYAVDFVPKGDIKDAFKKISESCIAFDQLIIERVGGKEWIHISFAPELRNAAFAINE